MKKITTLIALILITSCANKDDDCHNEKALASEYYSYLVEQSSGQQSELLVRELKKYIEVNACSCMYFTNLKRIEQEYNALLQQATTPEQVNQLTTQRQNEVLEISACLN